MRTRYLSFVVFSAAAILVGFFAGGCSTNTPAFDGIANRGITPVSAESPYIGTNVFLAQEMEQSLFLYNFIQSRGSPQAIQLQGNGEMKSELMMFYSREREYYSAIPRIDPATKGREWIIRGPFPITREHYPHVAHLSPDNGGVFEVFGRRETYGGPGKAVESRVISPAFIPTPAPTPIPVRKRVKKAAQPVSAADESSGPSIAVQGTPFNLDQEALFEARRTPTVTAATPAAQPSPKAAAAPNRPSLGAALQSAVSSTPVATSTPKPAK
jgi:hypothetical protein